MTGGKNSRWTELLREGPISLYMASSFRSALVPLAGVDKLLRREGYTAQQLSTAWSERKTVSHWRKRDGRSRPFVTLSPKPGELVRQCAKTFAAEGKWDHLAVLATVTPMLLVPRPDEGDEIDPSLYVMF